MTNQRIAITGAGAVCSIGIGTEEIAHALLDGRSGIGHPLLGLPYPDLHVGEVRLSNAGIRERLGLGADGDVKAAKQ